MNKRTKRSSLDGLCLAVFFVYILFRLTTTVLIMPLAVSGLDTTSTYFIAILFLSIVTTIIAFTEYRLATAALAVILVALALVFWWIVVCKKGSPIWADFKWDVLPELCFACAAGMRWRLSRSLTR